ncbi:doublecortin domain-containing protein 2 [Ambystoma mexicanum]|uniref:doublecortin domain-containing protein 2 n=1 Tax=Ambystoma mexicanum TaxID=8296 RepID=UPI0037E710CC
MAMNGGSRAPSLSQQPAVKSVLVYRNGDPFYRGRRMLIHEKKVGTFEIFLRELTGGVGGPFGAAVRNVYTPRAGHRVKSLEDLRSGEHYVAGGGECFKKIDYLQIGDVKKKPADLFSQVKPVSHSRINVSARFRKPIQEPCTIFVIANGDILNPAIRLLIPRKSVNQWEHVLAMVTDKVHLRTGAVHRLYTLEGKLVQDGSELENGQFYVAVGRDKFKKLPYGDLIFSKSSMRRSHGPKASSLPPINGSRKFKENGHDRQSKSTEGYSDSADALISPQPPKRKVGKQRAASEEEALFPNKPVKITHTVRSENPPFVFPENDDSIFKAGEERSETWGAVEVQEDEDTQVEVPVDQRAAETVEEENDLLAEDGDDSEEVNNEETGAEELVEEVEYQIENEVVEDPEEEEREEVEEEEIEELGDTEVTAEEVAEEETHQNDSEDAEILDELGEEETDPLHSEIHEDSGEEEEHSTSQNDFHPETEDQDGADDNQSQAEEEDDRRTSSQLEDTSPRESATKDYAAVA